MQRIRKFSQIHALWRASFATASANYQSFPEPRPRGIASRGFQYVAGNFFIEGELVAAPKKTLWELCEQFPTMVEEAQSFEWVDDLIVTGSKDAALLARQWVSLWIEAEDHRNQLRWRPDITAKRLIRFVNHGASLLAGRSESEQNDYFQHLSKHVAYLKRISHFVKGLDRIEHSIALIFAQCATNISNATIQKHVKELGEDVFSSIAEDGSIPSRNPEELLYYFSLLSWVTRVLDALEIEQDRQILRAIERIAPALRALRFANGNLACFQKGGIGPKQRLDQALADSRVRAPAHRLGAMGYVRFDAASTCVLADGEAGALPSFSAFEMTSERCALVQNSSAGAWFGKKWFEKAMQAKAHSCVTMTEMANPTEKDISVDRHDTVEGQSALFKNKAMYAQFGAIFERNLKLAPDGMALFGHEKISFENDAKFVTARMRSQIKMGRVHFHLAPRVSAQLDMGNSVVSLKLDNGEIWILRQEGGRLRLAPSFILDSNRPQPIATQQAQIIFELREAGSAVSWIIERMK